MDIRADELIGVTIILRGRHTYALQPLFGSFAQVEFHIIVLGETHMELRTGEEEEVEFLPQRHGIIDADRDHQIMLHHLVLDHLHLHALGGHGTPVLVCLAVQDRIVQTGLQTKMHRQQEGERSAYLSAVEVHLREGGTMCVLVVLRKTELDAVLHTELIRLFGPRLTRWVEERVIGYLQIRRTCLIVRPHADTACAY